MYLYKMNVYQFWKLKSYFTTLSILIALKSLSAQPINIVTPDALTAGIEIQNFECFVDQTGRMPFDVVQGQMFLPLTDTCFAIPPFQGGWTRFKLQNTAQGASVSGVIKFDKKIDWIDVWQGDGATFMKQRTGSRLNCSRLSLSDLDDCVPFELKEGETKVIFTKLRIHDGQVLKVPFMHLKTYQQAIHEDENNANSSWKSLFRREIFAQGLLFILLIICIFWLFIRGKILAWYIAHNVGVICYFSMNVAIVVHYRNLFCFWRDWTLPVQIMATYAVLICYISFSRVLLDTETENAKLDRLIRKALGLVLVIAIIQFGVLCFFSLQAAFDFYNIARFICLPIWLGLTLSYIFALRSKIRWLVIIGSIAKILPAYFTFIHHIFPGEYRYEIDNIWRVIYTKHGKFGMYSIQIGILIELVCFFIAVAFKIREEKQKRDRLLLRVTAQVLQIDSLSSEMKTLKAMASVLTKSGDTLEKPQSKFLKATLATIEVHLSDPTFGVDQLAEKISLSRAQLHRKIKDETGDSASQIILSARLAKAMHLLQSTDQSVKEIASACGFFDAKYFGKVFKNYFDETPSDFREKRF